jgi:putative FmdB family regulatory protein
MPNYDYECDVCGHRFEVFQRMNDAKLEDCPVDGCGGRVRRLLGTGAGLIFKGSGFYQTDYRSSSYREAAKGDSSGGADGGKSSADTAKAAPAKTGGCGGGCACASH